MSGLTNKTGGATYLRIREHSYIENGREKTKYGFARNKEEVPYSTLTGQITNMYYRDETYEGNPIRKLVTIVTDEEGNDYNVGLNVESPLYSSYVSFLANVDVTRPVSLHPRQEDVTRGGETVSRRSMLISQMNLNKDTGKEEETYAKSFFNADNPLPKWEKVRVNNKEVTDKSAFLQALEEFVNTNFIPVVSGNAAPVVKKEPKNIKSEQEPFKENPFPDNDTRLPWEN